MVLWKSAARTIVDFVVITAVITFIPGLPPYENFSAFELPPTPAFEGALEANNHLESVEFLFDGKILGPESFAKNPKTPGSDEIYTGLQGGAVVKVLDDGKRMVPVAKLGEACGGPWDAMKCGRPLGIQFDKEGNLIVADCYMGLYKVDVETGKHQVLVPKDMPLDGGKPAKVFNNFDIAEDGTIYWSDSSANYYLHEGIGEMLGEPSGRLFKYDPKTNTSQMLVDKIHFANGVRLSPNEDFVVVAETFRARLLRYWLKGEKKGTKDILIERLPGNPDNLRLSPKGNLLVAIVSVHLPGQIDLPSILAPYPLLRKFILRTLFLFRLPFSLVARYLNVELAAKIESQILNMETAKSFVPKYGLLVEVDWEGKIVGSWHSPEGRVHMISEGFFVNDTLYLGSPYNDYLGRVQLNRPLGHIKVRTEGDIDIEVL